MNISSDVNVQKVEHFIILIAYKVNFLIYSNSMINLHNYT